MKSPGWNLTWSLLAQGQAPLGLVLLGLGVPTTASASATSAASAAVGAALPALPHHAGALHTMPGFF